MLAVASSVATLAGMPSHCTRTKVLPGVRFRPLLQFFCSVGAPARPRNIPYARLSGGSHRSEAGQDAVARGARRAEVRFRDPQGAPACEVTLQPPRRLARLASASPCVLAPRPGRTTAQTGRGDAGGHGSQRDGKTQGGVPARCRGCSAGLAGAAAAAVRAVAACARAGRVGGTGTRGVRDVDVLVPLPPHPRPTP